MKKYTTGEKIRQILIVILTAVNIAAWGTVIYREATREPEYIDSWEITVNRNIEWEWAGKP